MEIPEVDCTEAVAMREAGTVWIDVREPDEWQDAHIEHTLHLPLAAAAEQIPVQWPQLDTPMVISCLSGGRSGQLVAHLRALGYSDVHNLRGGIRAWVQEARPVITGA